MDIMTALEEVLDMARGHKRTPTEQQLAAISMVEKFKAYIAPEQVEKTKTTEE